MKSAFGWAVLLMGLTFASRGYAAPRRGMLDPDTEAARRHFEAGAILYDEGSYREAMAEFEAAYQIKSVPAFLYNIARCHDRLEHWTEAADGYEQYLMAEPSAPEAAELNRRIELLRARARMQKPKAVPSETVESEPPLPPPKEIVLKASEPPAKPPFGKLRLAAILVGSGALVSAAVATGLYLSARNDFTQLQSECRLRQCGPSDSAGASQKATAAYALWGVAGAAAAADIALWIMDAKRRAPTAKRQAFFWSTGPGLGLSLQGEF